MKHAVGLSMFFDQLGLLGACNGGDVNGDCNIFKTWYGSVLAGCPCHSVGMVPLVNGVQIPWWSDDLYPSYSKVPKASVVLQLHGPALIFA